MARDDPHFRLRIPADLRDRVTASAKHNNRSMNAEIVARLEEAFDGRPKWMGPNADPAIQTAIKEAMSQYLDGVQRSNESMLEYTKQVNEIFRQHVKLKDDNARLKAKLKET